MYEKETLNIYFVRHGETEWNTEDRIQGQLDSELTKKGIKETYLLREKLSSVNFSAVYSSELGRAYKTAEILREDNNIKIEKLEELNEKYFGYWQGLEKKEIFSKYPEQAENYFNNIEKYNSVEISAESLSDTLNRFIRGVDKIINANKNGNVLVISHGTILKFFFNHIDKKDIKDLRENDLMENASYRVLRYYSKKLIRR